MKTKKSHICTASLSRLYDVAHCIILITFYELFVDLIKAIDFRDLCDLQLTRYSRTKHRHRQVKGKSKESYHHQSKNYL